MIKFNIAEFFIVSGGVHGIIFSILLLIRSKRENFRQNLALLSFIISFCLTILNGWYIGSGYYLESPSLLSFPIYLTLAIGPAFYAYVSYLIHKNYVFKGLQLLHLLPAFIQFSYHLFVFTLPLDLRMNYFQENYLFFFLPIEELVGMISVGVYFALSYRILRQYQKSVYNNYTNLSQVLYKWLRYFIVAIWLFLVSWVCFSLIDFFVYDYRQTYAFYYPIYIAIVIFLYWIIVEGFFNPLKIQPHYVINTNNGVPPISKGQSSEYLNKLHELMKEKQMYLRPKLSLQELAEHLDINPKYLSSIINKETNKNFYDFVNEYRIEKAKSELVSAENKHLTISAISVNCGFNSKSTFNEVFKKYTGLTPSVFMKSKF